MHLVGYLYEGWKQCPGTELMIKYIIDIIVLTFIPLLRKVQ
jgi:hypothetical protein